MIGLIYAGNVVWPDRSSATFRSVLENLDQRVKLDKSIRAGDKKYNASLAMMASKLAYENEAFVQTTVKKQWSTVSITYKPKHNTCTRLFNFKVKDFLVYMIWKLYFLIPQF
jgi:hypothetical protein